MVVNTRVDTKLTFSSLCDVAATARLDKVG